MTSGHTNYPDQPVDIIALGLGRLITDSQTRHFISEEEIEPIYMSIAHGEACLNILLESYGETVARQVLKALTETFDQWCKEEKLYDDAE